MSPSRVHGRWQKTHPESWRMQELIPRVCSKASMQSFWTRPMTALHRCLISVLVSYRGSSVQLMQQASFISWVTTGWASARSLMQVSTANVVPDGQQRLLSTTNDVTIFIYIYLLFVLLILLLLLLLLLLLARARFSMIVGPWLAGARFSLICS